MLRIITIVVFVATLSVTAVLYKLKYDTRSLQLTAVELRRQIDAERSQLAVLKAEWSVLTQPARIDQLASELGLKPLSPKQIISFRELNDVPRLPQKPVAAKPTPFVRKINFEPAKGQDLKDFITDINGFESVSEPGE
ncbi:MAG: hypothetical protein DHS20C08_24730 [Rhodomicrobium sp.]|nr:MAG: hypothetical protein DHS20C08_24730 [Rhodomicrobium sp.]